ncbi:IS30 family transposase [Salinicoccus sp. HZC-1]|uniref:IS30 family transposase n=1 Tax=Salinicoccus sp. HZC-1 TaxID=3385497 RepID=UPI00398BB349
MTQFHDTTESNRGKHLTPDERAQIAVLKQEKYSNRMIARRLGRAPQTIHNEVRKGTITQLKRQTHNERQYDYYYETYCPDRGQTVYDSRRKHCGRRPKWSVSDGFVDWADTQMLNHHWSPDAVVGAAKTMDAFSADMVPGTTTLYDWINAGIMRTKNIDLPEKLQRQTKSRSSRDREHKRVLGPSISERPEAVEDRQTFGHWEIDTVIGEKHKQDPVLLTLVERQTRFEVLIKLDNKDAESVTHAIEGLSSRIGIGMSTLFKSITADNGSEFGALHAQLKGITDVYFARPYASYERGTSENQHKLIRRFIPKHTAMMSISDRQIQRIQRWMNDYPRKILGYQTPHETIVRALKQEKAAV